MPKFKDLGINAIPLTMQPPAIGDGGGGHHGGQYNDTICPDENTCGDTCVCSDDDDQGGRHRVDTQCPDQNTCGDTCVCSDDDKYDAGVDTICPDENTCGDTCVQGDRDKGKSTAAFAPEAVAQLRQQLEDQIGR